MEKICSKCGIEKPLSEFHKASDKKQGVKSACKLCCNSSRDQTSEKYKLKRKYWGNKDTKKKRNYKKVQLITKSYTGKLLRKQYGLTTEELNMIPKLHELKRIEIKNKRLC